MSMSPERSRQLHNFSLPPVLKWGSQRLLRCSLDNRSSILHHRSPPAQPIGTTTSKFRFTDDDCNGIKAVREKLILDLRADANNMMQLSSMLTEEERVAAIEEDDSASVRPPWNLRTRRAAACKAAAQPPPPVQSIANANARPSGGGGGRFRGGFGGAGNHIHGGVEKKKEKEKEKEKEKTKFSVSLAKDEIEDDFYAMVGMRPRRRPRKRAKVVQNYMNSMFPGLWLTEVTPESYKVPEIPES